MKGKGCVILAAVLLTLSVIVGAVLLIVSIGGLAGFGKQSIVVIRIDDIIYDAAAFTDRIDRYKGRDDVKAFVFRMETPGGTVAASQELTNAFNRLRQDTKIVVVSVGNLGASGGYYAACGADLIVANPGSLVGSIGVIMEHMEIARLAEKLGVRFDAITSGPMKEAGTISRPMRPEERAMIQGVIDDAYAQFFGTVIESRWYSIAARHQLDDGDSAAIEAALRRVADGRILTGAQAYDAGLIDELGDLQVALDLAAAQAGIEDEPNIIVDKPEDPWRDFREIFGLARNFSIRSPLTVLPPSGLWYLYR
jgi:protease-4